MIKNQEIENWRESWKTKKTEKLLSIKEISNQDEIIKESIKRAYSPSVQNTALKQGKYGPKKLQALKEICEPVMFEYFVKIVNNKELDEQIFEKWEKNLADKIRSIYLENEIALYTYGNAQKWINMAIKYMFSSDKTNPNDMLYQVCYLPIDRIIQDKAYKELGVKKLPVAWSKCDDWNEIQSYQKRIKKAIIEKTNYDSRLWWECNAWTVNIEQIGKNILNKHKKAFVELAK